MALVSHASQEQRPHGQSVNEGHQGLYETPNMQPQPA